MEDQLRNSIHAAFRFVVEIAGVRVGAFTECTLPTIEWDVQEVKEGGLNTFVHALPGMRKRATLTLKNGIGNDDLLRWCTETMSEQFSRKAITVTLLNVRHEPFLNWHIDGAYPVKWTAPQLKTSENTVAIQSIELACGEIRVEAS